MKQLPLAYITLHNLCLILFFIKCILPLLYTVYTVFSHSSMRGSASFGAGKLATKKLLPLLPYSIFPHIYGWQERVGVK